VPEKIDIEKYLKKKDFLDRPRIREFMGEKRPL